MNKRDVAIFALLLLSLFCLPPSKAAEEALSISRPIGYVPLTIHIDGPSRIADRARNWDGRWEKFGGAGFAIDWGDGVHEPSLEMRGHPTNLAVHTYNRPGNYVVKATLFHPGADDAAVTEWSAFANVKVLARASK